MSFYPISESEFREICQGMEQAEANGFFDGMFSGECRSPELPSKEKLLQSIRPGMKLYKSFFMKVYGYSISDPGFAEKAISRLWIIAGCGKGDEYYSQIVNEYKRQQEEEQQRNKHNLSDRIDRDFENMRRAAQERGEEQRKQEIIQKLLQKSDSELLRLWQKKQ